MNKRVMAALEARAGRRRQDVAAVLASDAEISVRDLVGGLEQDYVVALLYLPACRGWAAQRIRADRDSVAVFQALASFLRGWHSYVVEDGLIDDVRALWLQQLALFDGECPTFELFMSGSCPAQAANRSRTVGDVFELLLEAGVERRGEFFPLLFHCWQEAGTPARSAVYCDLMAKVRCASERSMLPQSETLRRAAFAHDPLERHFATARAQLIGQFGQAGLASIAAAFFADIFPADR